MLLATQTTLALRCPECGKLDLHRVSLFDFGGRRNVRLVCKCGVEKGTLGTQGDRFWLRYSCLLCDQVHFAYFPRAQFWDPRLKTMHCPDSDLEVGFFGLDEEVRTTAEASRLPSPDESEMYDDALGEFFANPEVMHRLLQRLHELTQHGQLACPCGHKGIRVEIFPERLELCCPKCGRFRPIPAERDRDAATLDEAPLGADPNWRRRGGAHRPEQGS